MTDGSQNAGRSSHADLMVEAVEAEVEAGSIAELREKALHEGELMPSSNLKDTPGVGDQDVSAMNLLSYATLSPM